MPERPKLKLGREEPGRLDTPLGREVAPPGLSAGRPGRTVVTPLGRVVAPPGRPEGRSGRVTLPGRVVTPPGRTVAPPGKVTDGRDGDEGRVTLEGREGLGRVTDGGRDTGVEGRVIPDGR